MAATQTFMRYGVKRTSLAEIAKTAGVSRQSLYLNFSNKDEVLAACMAEWIEDLITNLDIRWTECTTLSEKIDVYFDTGVRKPFDHLQAMPDAKDVLNGYGEATGNAALVLECKKAEKLAAQIAPHAGNAASIDPDAIATLVVRSTKEFVSTAKDRAELDGLLRTLKTMVMATMQQNA